MVTAQPGDDNDGAVSDNIAAAAETSVSEMLLFLSVLLKFFSPQVWKDRLRQRVRPEERLVKNPWAVLDSHSPTKGTKPFRKGQY